MGRKYLATRDEDGTWSVIDTDGELPAVLDGVPQVGLGQEEAELIAETLSTMLDDEDG